MIDLPHFPYHRDPMASECLRTTDEACDCCGVKRGITYGATDELGHSIAENPVHVHDLNATLLHLLGLDHERLTYRYQGRDYRLTDVHGHVVKGLLA